MTNFRIEFLYPWLLLLLVPMLAVAFFFHFRISKRYRRTRNRIVSLVLHCIVAVLSVLTLSGINFKYEIPNLETEVILLVDSSYSGESIEEQKNKFIKEAIEESEDVCQIGIVKFGYGEPVYAVPLTTDISTAYEDYSLAYMPEFSKTGTDLASALTYTKDLFKNKEVAKIVVISDGMETDGKVMNVVREVAAEGIEVNAVYFPSELPTQEIQLEGVKTPDYNVSVGDEFKVSVAVRSSYEGNVKIELEDNGELVGEKTVALHSGIQEIEMEHRFSRPELHALTFRVSGGSDEHKQNNVYQAFIYVENFTEILLVERNEGEAQNLELLLKEENEAFNIETLNILTSDKVPTHVDQLRKYDQVVLVNIADADMPNGFIDILHSYVNDFGGGMLTVGGNKVGSDGTPIYEGGNVVANAYNREDMYDTLYQEMLPVQAIDYTPPLAVMLIIDRSGSMDMEAGSDGTKKLELAKQGARACLNALTERDYCGILTLEEKYTEAMHVVPMTQRSKLEKAIDGIVTGGGTVYEDALRGAAEALQAVNVERRHIILVSDGMPADDYDEYTLPIQQYANDVNAPVTFSFVVIGEDISASEKQDLRNAAALGNGRFYDPANVNNLPMIMREELKMPEIKAINPEPFRPQIDTYNNVVSGINQADIPVLNGYYGTKMKSGADMILKGEFVPIYAQWKYGEGMVGSFMCDLNRVWSNDFMSDATGRRLVLNIINSLFPTKNIRPQDVTMELNAQNYTMQMSVYTDMKKGEAIELEIARPDNSGNLTTVNRIRLGEDEGYSRINFALTELGVYKLTVRKFDAEGKEVAKSYMYKEFSYSQEYNFFYEPQEGEDLLRSMTISGEGEMMEKASEIYREIAKTLHRSYDPRVPFMIIALVLFLTDIAVRKFKFKWLHEIVRDSKAKKELKQKSI